MTESRQQRIAALSEVGYLAGYHPVPRNTGVLVYSRGNAYEGYNFFTSGHGPEALLMDMEGHVVHTWNRGYDDEWPEHDSAGKTPEFQQNTAYWRRAHLFPNGDVLAIFGGLALLKLDRNSRLLWAVRGGFHHDLDILDDGRIFVLTRIERDRRPALSRPRSIIDDAVTVLNSEGRLIKRVSILDALAHSDYASLLEHLPSDPDLLHTNTIEVLNGRLEHRSPAFRQENVLLSMRSIGVIAVLDVGAEEVVWATRGPWKMQHQPTVLDNGNILLFDNRYARGASRVIEFDPFTQNIVWQYQGNEDNRFNSMLLGSNQRLPNGNTLITDSMNGRAFEVTPEKKVVWDFINTHRVEPAGQLISTVLDMLRVEYEYLGDWID